jgi:hypothetical protein
VNADHYYYEIKPEEEISISYPNALGFDENQFEFRYEYPVGYWGVTVQLLVRNLPISNSSIDFKFVTQVNPSQAVIVYNDVQLDISESDNGSLIYEGEIQPNEFADFVITILEPCGDDCIESGTVTLYPESSGKYDLLVSYSILEPGKREEVPLLYQGFIFAFTLLVIFRKIKK